MSLDISNTISVFARYSSVIEIRIPKANKYGGTYAGYYDNFAKLIEDVKKYNGKVPSIYFSLNPVEPALLARANNRIDENAKLTTQDGDITKRVWLYVDIDPVRPAGISSTNEEHKAAIAKAYHIKEEMAKSGWASPLIGDSGNGASLLYKIDLPNTPESMEVIKGVLSAFEFFYTDDEISIDQSVFNAARIVKLFGTIARKGDNTPDRPHRESRLLEIPAEIKEVTPGQLKEYIAKVPKETEDTNESVQQSGFDIELWMRQYDIAVAHKKMWNGGTVYNLEQCPFDSNHKTPDSSIIKTKKGALVFHCFHNSCRGNDWKKLREMKEPDRVQRKERKKSTTPTGNANTEYHLTDLGNANRLASVINGDARYCYPYKSWLVWNSKRWADDKIGKIERHAMDTVLDIYDEARRIDDYDRRKALMDFAIKSESAKSIRAMVELARPLDNIPILPDDMDKDKMLFNIQNGTIDLKTGVLKPHDKNDKITKISPVVYDPAAKCPVWLDFLNTIFQGKQKLIEYVQKQAGYALTGDTREEDFNILYGTGGNGKSKYVNQIMYIMGDYAVKAKVETILNSKDTQNGSSASSDVAMLCGARLVVASEPDYDKELKEGRVKEFTGRDPITARRLYQAEFTYLPEFKFWLITNHKPIIKSQDKGIWRRIKLNPFDVTIPDDKIDKNLDIKLKAESSGILNWMIEGCLKWQNEGMNIPDEVREATQDYKEDMDILGEFVDKCCEVDKTGITPNKWLFLTYKAWCNLVNIRPMSFKTFPRALEERGYKRTPKTDKGIGFKGLRLIRQVLEFVSKMETVTGEPETDELTNLTNILRTFYKLTPYREFPESASNSSYSSGKVAAVAKNVSSGNEGKPDELSVIRQPLPVTELSQLLEKGRPIYEHDKGAINSSNIVKFSLWFCEKYKPVWKHNGESGDYQPSAIMGIATKLFKITPGTEAI